MTLPRRDWTVSPDAPEGWADEGPLLAVTWASYFQEGEPPIMALKPGDNAPDFSLHTHEGKTLVLKDLRGRKVLLWFYPEADTPG